MTYFSNDAVPWRGAVLPVPGQDEGGSLLRPLVANSPDGLDILLLCACGGELGPDAAYVLGYDAAVALAVKPPYGLVHALTVEHETRILREELYDVELTPGELYGSSPGVSSTS